MFELSYRQICKEHFIINEILTLPSLYLIYETLVFYKTYKDNGFQIHVSRVLIPGNITYYTPHIG